MQLLDWPGSESLQAAEEKQQPGFPSTLLGPHSQLRQPLLASTAQCPVSCAQYPGEEVRELRKDNWITVYLASLCDFSKPSDNRSYKLQTTSVKRAISSRVRHATGEPGKKGQETCFW
jgi:hypothetical protein